MLTVNAQAKDGKSVNDYETKISEIVTKAKTEGANWSVDDWKANLTEAMKAMKPMFDEAAAFKKKTDEIKDDPSKLADLMKEAQEMEKKFGDSVKLFDEIEKIAKESENGKKVIEDEEWLKGVAKDLGIDVDAFD